MTQSAWLHIIGVGANGEESLSPLALSVLREAEVIFAGKRLHKLIPAGSAERRYWPSPFDPMIDELKLLRGRRVVILTSGDPLWYSAGRKIREAFAKSETIYHPQLSSFQLAASELRWSLEDIETLSVHGRAAEMITPFLAPRAHLLMLTSDRNTTKEVSEILQSQGYGASRLIALSDLGTPHMRVTEGVATTPPEPQSDFYVLAVECLASLGARPTGSGIGLPDELFQSDGTITKREVRAATLAKLRPMRGHYLWDIGAGCGSVAIEWIRSARAARATAIEPRAERRDFAIKNAVKLGAANLEVIAGNAPSALQGLDAPDAVFIGGGLSFEVFENAWEALLPEGRMVINAVTLESEALLREIFAQNGGELTRISVERAAPVGSRTGWRPLMTVTQWSRTK